MEEIPSQKYFFSFKQMFLLPQDVVREIFSLYEWVEILHGGWWGTRNDVRNKLGVRLCREPPETLASVILEQLLPWGHKPRKRRGPTAWQPKVLGKQGGSIRPQMGKELKAFFDWCQTIVLLASGKWNSEQQNTIIWGQSKRSHSAPSWNTFGLFDPLRKKYIMDTLIYFEKETNTKILCFLF